MTSDTSEKLERADIVRLTSVGEERPYVKGEVLFTEGEPADHVYFVLKGELAVTIQEFNNRVEIGHLSEGDILGEMAVINNGIRSATVTAMSDVVVVALDKAAFNAMLQGESTVAHHLKRIVEGRTESLSIRENILASTGLDRKKVRVAIAGDPSMRETAFERERYESRVDKVLSELVEKLQELLLDRSVSELYIQFNSSEIGLTTILDPFNYEIHPVEKLIDSAYLDRHFPKMEFTQKAEIIRKMYAAIGQDLPNLDIPDHLKKSYRKYYEEWHPLAQEEITHVLGTLVALRKIQNFYLRNFGISITRDTIRMQFNCDGTHIVSAQEYQDFLDENIDLSE